MPSRSSAPRSTRLESRPVEEAISSSLMAFARSIFSAVSNRVRSSPSRRATCAARSLGLASVELPCIYVSSLGGSWGGGACNGGDRDGGLRPVVCVVGHEQDVVWNAEEAF